MIGICVHNQGAFLPVALTSALAQSVVTAGRAVVLLLDDRSTDAWQSGIYPLLEHPQVLVVGGNCGSPARSRNAVLDFVDERFPSARWVARLDADDQFADEGAIAALCQQGDIENASYVIGSNHLSCGGRVLPWSNIADPDELKNPARLLSLIESFASGAGQRELPSCNLVLRTHRGIRYPEIRGAEDHWLVASLLILQPSQGAVVPSPVYSIYTVEGAESASNKVLGEWTSQRCRLAEAARLWIEVSRSGDEILGAGQEGIVWRESGAVWKQFYPWALSLEDQAKVEATLSCAPACIPQPIWQRSGRDGARLYYPDFPSTALAGTVDQGRVMEFLRGMLESGVVTSNVKRSNLRMSEDGRLMYIDIGKDIVPFTVSRFLDAAARAYGVCVLGYSDYELARRSTEHKQHDALDLLPGFREFYLQLIESSFPHVCSPSAEVMRPRVAQDVTLLIKACAQDVATISDQVEHIVSQLSYPSAFWSVTVAVDPYEGPYLRQHAVGDLVGVLGALNELRRKGVIDQVLVAPDERGAIEGVYRRWFADDSVVATHTSSMAPLFAQLWAFGQIKTRYVLQCDADVLVGRRDFDHDYLDEMLGALSAEEILGVGFNIPKAPGDLTLYDAPPGGGACLKFVWGFLILYGFMRSYP